MRTSTLAAVVEPFVGHTPAKSPQELSTFSPNVLQLMVKDTVLQFFPIKHFSLKITTSDIGQSQQFWGKTDLTHCLIRLEKSVVPFCNNLHSTLLNVR